MLDNMIKLAIWGIAICTYTMMHSNLHKQILPSTKVSLVGHLQIMESSEMATHSSSHRPFSMSHVKAA